MHTTIEIDIEDAIKNLRLTEREHLSKKMVKDNLDVSGIIEAAKEVLNETIDAEKAIASQIKYLKERAKLNDGDWMNADFAKGIGFAPQDGICYNCHKQIYDNAIVKQRNWKTGELEEVVSKGISVEKASTELTTGCPHCHRSFVD